MNKSINDTNVSLDLVKYTRIKANNIQTIDNVDTKPIILFSSTGNYSEMIKYILSFEKM